MSRVFLVASLRSEHRISEDLKYEVQLVDEFGQVLDSALFGSLGSIVHAGGGVVPAPVIEAAKKLEAGESRYVDGAGADTYPGANPVATRAEGVYYVRNLAAAAEGREDGYEVQSVNEAGQMIESACFSDLASEVQLGGEPVPRAVMEAATKQREGKGVFVNASGEEVLPPTP